MGDWGNPVTMILSRPLFDGLRLGLLGGSFNPAHEGHREISLVALQKLGLDAVIWLVTPGNPQKPAGQYAPLADRIAAARAVAAHPKIHVSDVEARQGLRYTVDTIGFLKKTLPSAKFVWLMGADSLAGFHTWRDWRGIAGQVPMAVFSRPGDRLAPLTARAARILARDRLPASAALRLADSPPPAWIWLPGLNNPASSTAIRNVSRV